MTGCFNRLMLILITLFIPLTAAAAGPFLGVDVGASQVPPLGYGLTRGLFAGYNIDRYFGVEIGFNRLGAWTGHDQGVPYNLQINNVDVSGVGRYWLSRSVDLYARIGFDDWSTLGTSGTGEHRITGQSAGNDLVEELHQDFYGIGTSWHITRTVGLRMEYRIYQARQVDGNNLNMASLLIGATYHFH